MDQVIRDCVENLRKLYRAMTNLADIKIGSVAVLEVVSATSVGAFLNWGLPKDLFLPFSEQIWEVKPGEKVVVFVYLDKADRTTASMRLEKKLKKTATISDYKVNEKVDLILFDRTPLGFKAVVNQKHIGLIYANEVFKKLNYADEMVGFVSKVRDDGKIDLLLNQMGHQGADDVKDKILELLSSHNGFYPLTDKTEPDEIYKLFGVSKKKFKIALGALYKTRTIEVLENGIQLKK
ncbi:MAG: GntR family transcriptional regulator [Deltaproteobacteria bacterium]|jgi:predicted RNA-binding protein (virulence factor B family)|nr:GntR family transcriptional regulator [Deltaproteobacteria bacterium]